MAKYKVNMVYPDGTAKLEDEEFDTEEEAQEYGCYLCSCYDLGGENLNMSNPGDYPLSDAEADFEIVEEMESNVGCDCESMSVKTETHTFTYSEIERRFDACVDRTLGEIDSSDVFGRYAGKNKGIAGAVVEQSVLGYPADSKQEPDLEVDGMDVELKVTGLKHNGRREIVAKEPMSITAVSIGTIAGEEFDTSTLWHKLEHLLVFFYLYDPKVTVEYRGEDSGWRTVRNSTASYADFKVKGWNLHEWGHDDRQIIERDWTIVRDYIRSVNAEHEDEEERKELWPLISTNLNPQMMYLGTAPKYPHPPRFRLKNSVVTTLWNIAKGRRYEQLSDEPKTYSELDARCHELAIEYSGKTVSELAGHLGYGGSLRSKAVAESLVVRMFGGESRKMHKVELFAMTGITCRTVAITREGARTEDTKIFRIDLDEIQDRDIEWDDSLFRGHFAEQQLLCPVLQEPYDGAPFAENRFLGFKRLAFSESFVDDCALSTWNQMRSTVFEDRLVDEIDYDKDGVPRRNPNGTIRSAPNWPKARDNVVFVRGSGSDSFGKTECVNGVRMYRQYAWVKGSWIVGELSRQSFL